MWRLFDIEGWQCLVTVSENDNDEDTWQTTFAVAFDVTGAPSQIRVPVDTRSRISDSLTGRTLSDAHIANSLAAIKRSKKYSTMKAIAEKVRERHIATGETYATLGEIFGISRGVVGKIIRSESYT
jgi:hypothetical protein